MSRAPSSRKLERAILNPRSRAPAAGRARRPRPLPGVFVGRGAELRTVLGALADAREGRGAAPLLAGEPGIGKTRLADEVAAHARDQGIHTTRGLVLGGRRGSCLLAVGAAGPCVHAEPRTRPSSIGVWALAPLSWRSSCPSCGSCWAGYRRSVIRDPEALRFRLFEAVVSFLGEIAATDRPLLVVIDDLHAADESSLLLLRNPAERSATAAFSCSAPTVIPNGGAMTVRAPVADLLRERGVTRIPLGDSRRDDVEAYVRLSIDGEASPQVVCAPQSHGRQSAVHSRDGPAPRRREPAREHGHRGRRAGWSARCGRAAAGATAGARATGAHRRVRARAPVDPGTLERLAGDARGRRGGHRDRGAPCDRGSRRSGRPALLPCARARRDLRGDPVAAATGLHRKAGEALERSHSADLGRHLAQLAHHFYEAAEDERARRYAAQAAELAATRLAYEEAARLYRLALTLSERSDDADKAEVCDLLLGLGDAQARAGDNAGAKQTFLRAAEVARRCGLAERLGRAALGYGGRWVWTRGRGDPHLLPLLEEAVKVLPPDDSALRARLLARLAAGPLGQEGDASMARRRALSAESVQIARRVGDVAVLAWTLDGRKVAIWAPDTLEEQWEIMAEMQELAERAGDPEQIVDARICRLIKLMERSELDRFDVEHAAARHVADELGQPGQRWLVAVHEPMYALLTGRLANADQLIEQAFELGGTRRRGTPGWHGCESVLCVRARGPPRGRGGGAARCRDGGGALPVAEGGPGRPLRRHGRHRSLPCRL